MVVPTAIVDECMIPRPRECWTGEGGGVLRRKGNATCARETKD